MTQIKKIDSSPKKMSRPLQELKMKAEKARQELLKAQMNLIKDMMNTEQIDLVKHWTTKVLKWNDLDEMNISQKAKID